jgi:Glycosyltransferase family 87
VKRFQIIVVSLCGLVVNALVLGPYALRSTSMGLNDFRMIYAGGKLAGTGLLYDPEAVMGVQREACQCASRDVVYNRPPYYALLLKPLALLSFRAANAIWIIAGFAALFAFAALWPGARWLTWVACGWSLPAFAAIAGGQDVTLLLPLVALALLWQGRGREGAAGTALALCAFKFNLFMFVPVLVLAQKRWRMLAGAAACLGVLTILSCAVSGWDWPVHYVQYLFANGNNSGELAMPNLHGLLLGVPFAGDIELGVIAATAVAAWMAMRRCSFERGLALALAAGVVLNHHSFLADTVLFLPALLLMARDSRGWVRKVAYVSLLPLVYVGVYMGSGIVVTRVFLPALVAVLFVLAFAQEGTSPNVTAVFGKEAGDRAVGT